MAPPSTIDGANGRVFSRDRFGVCTVQLDGYPSVIRVSTFQPGLAYHLNQRGCSALNPTPVLVDVGGYDIKRMTFEGTVRVGDSYCGDGAETESFSVRTTTEMIQVEQSSTTPSASKVVSRRMQPMVL
jgi:hypothetical protein